MKPEKEPVPASIKLRFIRRCSLFANKLAADMSNYYKLATTANLLIIHRLALPYGNSRAL